MSEKKKMALSMEPDGSYPTGGADAARLFVWDQGGDDKRCVGSVAVSVRWVGSPDGTDEDRQALLDAALAIRDSVRAGLENRFEYMRRTETGATTDEG